MTLLNLGLEEEHTFQTKEERLNETVLNDTGDTGIHLNLLPMKF